MHRRVLPIVAFAHCMLVAGALAQSVTYRGLLEEMLNRESLTRLPDPWFDCRQASSYDRASVSAADQAGWFANGDADKFVRVEERGGRKEWVMMDEAGPGAVVRIWSANPKGVLRVYLDGSETPVVEGPMADLLRSSGQIGGVAVGAPLSAERSRGCNLYLPIPYAERCLITSDEPGFYYQVNFRAYEAGTAVETLTHAAARRSSELLARTQARLAEPWRPMDAGEGDFTIAPGETREVRLPEGPAAAGQLFIIPAAGSPRDTLRTTVLEGEFDGERTIWCPAGDFFLTGPLFNQVQTWTNLVDPGTQTLRSAWLMPYATSGILRLHNLGDEPVTLRMGVAARAYAWDDRSMHFHAHWRQENPIHTRPMRDWNYIEASGEGVYVGDTLSVANPVLEWWGEGDEKIYVDGESFPSHFGTGTEDYYGYAWCWPGVFQGPFHTQPRCDGPGNYGHTTVARVRLLDGIPFRESIRTDMEVWHWAECDVGYAVTSFLYMRPGGSTNRAPMPEEAARGVIDPAPLPPPFRIEGALECEGLEVVSSSEGMTVGAQDMGGFARDKWSGNSHLWCQAREAGKSVELRIPVEGAGPRRVTLYATKSWDYGVLRFAVNGQPAGEELDAFSGRHGLVEPTGPIDLGVHQPRDGALTLRVTVVGSNPSSLDPKYFFALDAVRLEPAPR
jgi:hypothetical protein